MEAVYIDAQQVQLRATTATATSDEEEEAKEEVCATTMYSMVVEMQDTINADRDNDSDCDSKMVWVPNEDNFSIIALKERVKNLSLQKQQSPQRQDFTPPTSLTQSGTSTLSSMSSQMAKEWLHMGDNNNPVTATTKRRGTTEYQQTANNNSKPVLSPSRLHSLHLPLPLSESNHSSSNQSNISSTSVSSSSLTRWLLGRRRSSCSTDNNSGNRNHHRRRKSATRDGDKIGLLTQDSSTTAGETRVTTRNNVNNHIANVSTRITRQTRDRLREGERPYRVCLMVNSGRMGLRNNRNTFNRNNKKNNRKKDTIWKETSSCWEELKDEEDAEEEIIITMKKKNHLHHDDDDDAIKRTASGSGEATNEQETSYSESDSDSDEEEVCKWREATDTKTGKTYYYHIETRQSQWQKPIELASKTEREEAERKERETREFFSTMEANILKSISAGAFTAPAGTATTTASGDATDGTSPSSAELKTGDSQEEEEKSKEDESDHLPENEEKTELPTIPVPKPQPLVRTISTMDQAVLRELVQRVPSHRNVLMNYTSSLNNLSQMSLGAVDDDDDIDDKGKAPTTTAGGGDQKKQQQQQEQHKSPQDVITQTVQQQQLQQSSTTTTTTATTGASTATIAAPVFQRTSSVTAPSHLVSIVEADDSQSDDSDNSSTPTGSELATNSSRDLDKAVARADSGEWTWTSTSVCSLGLDALEPTPKASRDGEQGNNKSMLLASSFNLLGDSTFSIGLSEEETGAMEKLAVISDEIANIEDEEDALLGDEIEDDLEGEGLLADDEEDEAVAFHRSWSTDPGPQEDIVYIPPPGFSSGGASSYPDDKTAAQPREILYIPPNAVTSESTITGTVDQQSKPKSTAIGTKPLTAATAQERPRPALPRPVGFYSKTNMDNGNNAPLLQKPPAMMARRNTCGTLFVSSTMSAPDKDATIKCVCGVYRAHILQSEMDGSTSYDNDDDDEYTIFNDWETNRTKLQKENHSNRRRRRRQRFKPLLPTLEEVTTFYRDVFTRAKMETDCIIMSLVYVERLVKSSSGKLRPNVENWRSILFSCMVLSSKVWDDLSMWNADFSQTCPAGVRFPLKRVNELEIEVLSALKYNVKVLASEYAKYYFLMRSMLIKSGLGGDDSACTTPLDVQGAKRLQHLSALYQSSTSASYSTMRSKSVGDIEVSSTLAESSPEKSSKEKVGKALLEHIVEM